MEGKDKMEEFFGEVISKYTLEQAIEDGHHADLGFLPLRMEGKALRLVATTGFLNTVNALQALHILVKTLKHIRPKKPTWIVFDQAEVKEHTEDEGRTLIVPFPIDKKAYVTLDDYGPHYVITLLLAEDY